jgi:outer membrane protein TolC
MTIAGALAGLSLAGCVSPKKYRHQADQVADRILAHEQSKALGRTEPIEIEPPADTLRRRLMIGQGLPYSDDASLGTKFLRPIPHWPEDDYLNLPYNLPTPPWMGDVPMKFTLLDALQVAAKNSREYQTQKEFVYLSALDLDFECDQFRDTFSGLLEGAFQTDRSGPDPVSDRTSSAVAGLTRRFGSGAELAAAIGIDLVALLSQDRVDSRGVFADATVAIPLLRGSGKHIVLEDLTQAERNVIYAIYGFERFKRVFAVDVASAYLDVLRQLDSIQNAEEQYEGLVRTTWRAKRHGDAGILDQIEVDQAVQSELSARSSWIRAQQQYEQQLDSFKQTLGLPTDANIELDREELSRLVQAVTDTMLAKTDMSGGAMADRITGDATVTLVPPGRGTPGPYELNEEEAVALALANRLDLRISQGAVDDRKRKVVVAADQLRAEATLFGSASAGGRRGSGSATLPNSQLDFYEGQYSADMSIDLPFERTAERNLYRASLIDLEGAVRDLQEIEDAVKQDIRDGLRNLLEDRENLFIQSDAVRLAKGRVRSTELSQEAGFVEIRDLLEARDDLLSAQNSFTGAVVSYRIGELSIQRDMGLLLVDENGLWTEFPRN